ncbi:MAG: ORF6N domain-containing protein [Candidatus Omnitrophica bacterium]|nr:ORF6N domain-containing protein [Candidatus Omnitrophota bacterium]
MKEIIPQDMIENRIFVIRGQKVMIDRDLAELYGVETKYLNRQVRYNSQRFPEEFAFHLTREEKDELVQNCHRFETMKHSITFPYVFTEHGVAMLSSVLNSEKAIRINIGISKTFMRLREVVATHKELAHKLAELERKMDKHDKDIGLIFEAIRQLMAPPPEKPKRLIGFKRP